MLMKGNGAMCRKWDGKVYRTVVMKSFSFLYLYHLINAEKTMLHFESDYLEGAHPWFRAVMQTNMEKTPGVWNGLLLRSGTGENTPGVRCA